MEARLPAHLEIAALSRLCEAQGGFATVLARGHREAGSILLVTMFRDDAPTLYERMPQLDGTRRFVRVEPKGVENSADFSSYLQRRRSQDPDLWILELDIADGARFVETLER